MSLVSVGDLHLWSRCRRQWYARCLGSDHRRHAAIPEGMTGESSLREGARAAAYGRALEHAELPNLWEASIGRSDGDPSLDAFNLVGDPESLDRWWRETQQALADHRSFSSGVVLYEGLFVHIEVARYRERLESWEVYLYRAATGVRGAYHAEGSALAYVLAGLEIPVSSIHLCYLNKRYNHTESDESVFLESNIAGRSFKNRDYVARDLARIHTALNGEYRIPDDYVCRQSCDLCVPGDGEQSMYDIATLHRGAQIGRELKAQGVFDIRTLPVDEIQLSTKQKIQIEAVSDRIRYADPRRLSAFVSSIEYPRFFLDFEAYAPAIPPFDGLGPYEHIPVIASVHIARSQDCEIEHVQFAAQPGRDDRPAMFEWLCGVLGNSGSIVVFGKGFESSMIAQLARIADKPEEGTEMRHRLVDLLTPFGDFLVYDPRQHGKVSLKRVLPVFTATGYQDETVKDGMHANLSYARRADTVDPSTEPERRAAAAARAVDATLVQTGESSTIATIEEIVAYCSVDTIAMARLLDELTSIAADGNRWTPIDV